MLQSSLGGCSSEAPIQIFPGAAVEGGQNLVPTSFHAPNHIIIHGNLAQTSVCTEERLDQISVALWSHSWRDAPDHFVSICSNWVWNHCLKMAGLWPPLARQPMEFWETAKTFGGGEQGATPPGSPQLVPFMQLYQYKDAYISIVIPIWERESAISV